LIAVAGQLEETVPSETLPLTALLHIDETQLGAAAEPTQAVERPGSDRPRLLQGTADLVAKTLEAVTGRLITPLGQLPLLRGLDLQGGAR
jgi:hypothetical protein